MNTHGLIIDFGKHKGTPYTQVPFGYLRWMANSSEMDSEKKKIALSEIKRRGVKLPEIHVSVHAIDRASFLALKTWKKDRNNEEGLCTWLERVSLEAIERNNLENGKYLHKGLKLVVEQGEEFPVLKTVMKDRKRDYPDS